MSIAKIEAALERIRKLESRRYETGDSRWNAVADTRPIFNELFANTPNGVMGLNTKTLLHPEATYLVIELTHGHYGCMRHGNVNFTRVGFQEIDGATMAVDLTSNAILGEMNLVATTPYRAWQHDFSYTSNPLREAAYTGFVFGSPSPQDTLARNTWVLPLSGPALRHPAFHRQADFGLEALANRVMALNILRKLDRENAAIDRDIAAQNTVVAETIAAAEAEFPPEEWDAELAKLMSTMDWTFDYADRPRVSYYDQRNLIKRRLNTLPTEVAISFLGVAGIDWRRAYILLNKSIRIAA